MATMTKSKKWLPYDDNRPGFRDYISVFDQQWQIPADVRTAADTALRMAAKELGIGADVLVIWYEADDDVDKGFSHPDHTHTIWVRKTTSYQQAMEVVAHELKHLSQYRSGYRPVTGTHAYSAKEAEAEQFHRTFMKQFWPR